MVKPWLGGCLVIDLYMWPPLIPQGRRSITDAQEAWNSWLCSVILPQQGHWVASNLAFAVLAGARATVFSYVIWLEYSGHYLNVSCPLSWSLARESRLWLGPSFVCTLWHFWIAGFSNIQSDIYEAKLNEQKVNQGTQHCVIPWVPRSLMSLPS